MNTNWKKQVMALCGFGLVSFGALGALSAQESECQTDADCGEGQICEIYGGVGVACPELPPCDGDDCPDEIECQEEFEEFGACVTAPIECDSDADCPTGLTCVSYSTDGGVACTEDSEGNVDCDEVSESFEESYCDFVPQECETDGDCPDNFECVAVASSGEDCPDIACPPGEDCPDFECDEEFEEILGCVPEQIECETDSQCPDDWTCYAFEETYCEGSTGSGGVPEPIDGEDGEGGMGGQEEEADEGDFDCETISESFCIPPGFDSIIGGNFSGESDVISEPGGEDEATNTGNRGDDADNAGAGESSGAEEEEDAGGCSVNGPVNSPSRGATLLLMLLGMMAMRRRRA